METQRGVKNKTQETDGGESFYIKAQLTILNRSQRRKTSFPIVLVRRPTLEREILGRSRRLESNPAITKSISYLGRHANWKGRLKGRSRGDQKKSKDESAVHRMVFVELEVVVDAVV